MEQPVELLVQPVDLSAEAQADPQTETETVEMAETVCPTVKSHPVEPILPEEPEETQKTETEEPEVPVLKTHHQDRL